MEKAEINNLVIRHLTTGDLDQYNALLRYAFQVTEQELAEIGWRSEEIKQSKFPVLERADVLGCFDGNKLVSQFAVYPLKMNIYNAVYPVGFVTSVCTYPEYSGHGIMTKLMRRSLCGMREKRRSFALLYPYSFPLYRKFGWEIISNKISFIITDRQIPSENTVPGFIRRVDWKSSDFMNLHTQFAQTTHGCLFRNSLAWEEYWRWDEDDTFVAVYYNAEGSPRGYMVYLIKDNIMHIKEMIYLNREAKKGLWKYIRAHDSMIHEIRGNSYYNEPIAFEMEDGDIKETIRPYTMGRIIDVEQFISHYHCDPAEKDTIISFDISDSFLEWNNRTFNIYFHAGRCTITNSPAEYHVAMSIATLTTLLIGYKNAAQLRKLERITGDNASIAKLDDVLLHEQPYISDYI
jgi:predicted acetyltransferase